MHVRGYICYTHLGHPAFALHTQKPQAHKARYDNDMVVNTECASKVSHEKSKRASRDQEGLSIPNAKSAHDASKQLSSTPKEMAGAGGDVWRKGRGMTEHDRNRVCICHALDSVESQKSAGLGSKQ